MIDDITPFTYREFVLKSWKYGDNPIGGDARAHALAMLVSECQEYLDDPTVDEAGDVCWATEAVAASWGLPPLLMTSLGWAPAKSLMRTCAIVARAQQKMMQGASPESWTDSLHAALAWIRAIAIRAGPEEIIRRNVAKLTKRYGGQVFSDIDLCRINLMEGT